MNAQAAISARRWPGRDGWLRLSLWSWLVLLVAALLVTVVWLAGRYEASQVQDRLDRDAADAVADIRNNLNRNLQDLQALESAGLTGEPWRQEALRLLRQHREWLRVERRNEAMGLRSYADSPFRAPAFARLGRANALPEITQACANARRFNGPGYAHTYYVPQTDGLGMEVLELCVPDMVAGRLRGFLVVTYSLTEMLTVMVGPQLRRGQGVAFTEADGTRLAMLGAPARSGRAFTAQQLLDLPGHTMVLRMDNWRASPDLFPNLIAAVVTGLAIALIAVLALLGRDMRRRQRAERDLAEALAFRKAMEDSLVTGLRARDLEGRTSYVNPAFCHMVGFEPGDLLGRDAPAPYWPPELADEYQKRQEVRLSGGTAPPREGFESVFVRKDGSRFPVLIIEAPLINAQGLHTGWMSAVLDISEQRRVEELSRASQERLQATARLATVGEMASLLSHELNQPLAAISSYANGSINLLEEGAPALPELRTAMRRIGEQAERAGRVIKSVHDFVRRRDQAREPVAPQRLLDAVMPLVSLQARKLGVRVQTRVDAGLPPVLCDRTMVEQVLLNLARNAMQAMDEAHVARPELVIAVRPAAGRHADQTPAWLEFSVADRGPGIAEDVRTQLFTPFFTTKAEGMGLGLSLCRTVVEQHGGALSFEPNEPQGTIFRFTLPAQPPTP